MNHHALKKSVSIYKRFGLIATVWSSFIFKTVLIKSMLKRAMHIAKFHIYDFIVV